MRKQPIVTGVYYHIYNRGVDKRDIFGDKNDLCRFVESIIEFNRVDVITSLANLRKTEIAPKALSGKKQNWGLPQFCFLFLILVLFLYE